jgi:hypothetical protein
MWSCAQLCRDGAISQIWCDETFIRHSLLCRAASPRLLQFGTGNHSRPRPCSSGSSDAEKRRCDRAARLAGMPPVSAEAFNIANDANFLLPNINVGVPAGGTITNTLTGFGRQVQLVAKIVF